MIHAYTQILKTGACIRTLDQHHEETVTALSWLPDGSGFISGGLDRKITIWVSYSICIFDFTGSESAQSYTPIYSTISFMVEL